MSNTPSDVAELYEESRRNISINAFTSSVMLSRKILMHIAVAQGAQPGQSFAQYVEYLAGNGYVPPNGKAWVDHIRKKGNEANHEIIVAAQADAMDLLSFTEMLLKFVYEFPAKVPVGSLPSPPKSP